MNGTAIEVSPRAPLGVCANEMHVMSSLRRLQLSNAVDLDNEQA